MKHFLLCNHCNHLNEIKSEYMVMCLSCGKKMDNNFTEWRRRNPGATFEDYLRTATMAENQLPPEPPKKQGGFQSKSLKNKIWIVAVAVLSANIGGWIAKTAFHAARSSLKTDTEILERQWVEKSYGEEDRITLATPWELDKSSLITIPDEVTQIIQKFESFESPDNKNEYLKVGLNIARYIAEVGQLDLQGAADGTMSGIKNQPGVTDFSYDEQPYSVNSTPGYIQKGFYSSDGFDFEFTSIGLFRELAYWQIIVVNKKGDETAQKASRQIIKSISI